MIKTQILSPFIVAIIVFVGGCSDSEFRNAVESGDTSEAQKLLEEGADANVSWRRVGTPSHVAAKANDTEMLKLLIDHGADVNAFADVNVFGDGVETTPLMVISGTDNIEVAALLIKADADVNLASRGKPGTSLTALHGACGATVDETESLEMVQLLVEAGADINRRGVNGMRPIHFAVFEDAESGERLQIVRYLLSKGADVNAQAIGGMTPLHLVSIRGTPEMVQLLVASGADPHASGQKLDSTPLNIAKKHGRDDLVKIMKQAQH